MASIFIGETNIFKNSVICQYLNCISTDNGNINRL